VKTTKKDFEVFKKECKKWIDIFELNNWEIMFIHSKRADNRAWINPSTDPRLVKIALGAEWINLEPDTISVNDIKRVAFHEICELLLEPLGYLAECRFITETEIEPARHDIIGKLENTIFKDSDQRNFNPSR